MQHLRALRRLAPPPPASCSKQTSKTKGQDPASRPHPTNSTLHTHLQPHRKSKKSVSWPNEKPHSERDKSRHTELFQDFVEPKYGSLFLFRAKSTLRPPVVRAGRLCVTAVRSVVASRCASAPMLCPCPRAVLRMSSQSIQKLQGAQRGKGGQLHQVQNRGNVPSAGCRRRDSRRHVTAQFFIRTLITADTRSPSELFIFE
jgi:hypothetical protein